MAAGLFFSLDGLDGCGKSTQIRRIQSRLSNLGLEIVSCVDPGGTIIGKKLREILLHQEPRPNMRCQALLFMASRAQLVEEIIHPALEQGKIVISDRYLLANVVYQGHAGGLSPETLWQAGQISTGGLLPDLSIVLDLPVEMARKRVTRPADKMESMPDPFFEKVRQGFLQEARLQPEKIKVVDATMPVEEVEEKIFSLLLEKLEKRKP